jgi:hypothetical protein
MAPPPADAAEFAHIAINLLDVREYLPELAHAYLRNMPVPHYENALLTIVGAGDTHAGFCDLVARRLERLIADNAQTLYPSEESSESRRALSWEPFADKLAREWGMPGGCADMRPEYRIAAGYVDLAVWMGMIRMAERGKLDLGNILAERETALKSLFALRAGQTIEPIAKRVSRQVEELRYSR